MKYIHKDEEDLLMMRLFLDFLIIEALKYNTLQPYTTQMSETARELIEAVELEEDSQLISSE